MSPPTVLNTKFLPSLASGQETAAAKKAAEIAETALQTSMLVNTIIMIPLSGPL